MIDIKLIRENPEAVKAGCRAKNSKVDIDVVAKLDTARRELIQKSEALKAQQNRESEEVAKAAPTERTAKIEALKKIKEQFKELETELEKTNTELDSLMRQIPNVPFADVPIGPDESGNIVDRQVGEKTVFDFAPKDHVELGEKLGIIDAERATKITGSRFVYLKGELVMMQNALAQLAMGIITNREKLREVIDAAGLDISDKPFVPVIPPLMIKPEVFARMARLEPRDERYHIPSDDLYLIGSAEHTLGPLHMDETLPENELPSRYVAFTPAFRREAGSYGKDTRGIIRLHQFDKMEMESFSVGEKSGDEQRLFVALQEHLLKLLKLPYQVVKICTGDMGSPDARQIDIECWMPGQNAYRETHTSDLMTDYQARRLGTRVRRNNGEIEFAHMNDATFAAMGRLLVAIIENYQQADGSIRVPDVLQPFMHGIKVIGPR